MDDILKTFSGFLTPTIAIIATYIAYQQYKLAKSKSRRELFDRRLVVYKATMEFIASVVRTPSTVKDSTLQFTRETADAFFLFKPDLIAFLDELSDKGWEIHVLNEELQNSQGNERKSKMRQKSEFFKWFGSQFATAKTKFSEYLALHD